VYVTRAGRKITGDGHDGPRERRVFDAQANWDAVIIQGWP
jgi:hypothetical protein